MELNTICLYRLTHIENIPHILHYGITHSHSEKRDAHFKPIGDSSLIDFRSTKMVNVNGKSIVLGDYIPFYFGIRMPMLYVIQHGYNYTYPVKAEDIVYVVLSLKKIMENTKLSFYFCDGHATDFLTQFYTRTDVARLPGLLDWEAINERHWSGEGVDTDLKRRKQAEFLMRGDVPVSCIIGYGCYNEIAKDKLRAAGVDINSIKIIPQAYY